MISSARLNSSKSNGQEEQQTEIKRVSFIGSSHASLVENMPKIIKEDQNDDLFLGKMSDMDFGANFETDIEKIIKRLEDEPEESNDHFEFNLRPNFDKCILNYAQVLPLDFDKKPSIGIDEIFKKTEETFFPKKLRKNRNELGISKKVSQKPCPRKAKQQEGRQQSIEMWQEVLLDNDKDKLRTKCTVVINRLSHSKILWKLFQNVQLSDIGDITKTFHLPKLKQSRFKHFNLVELKQKYLIKPQKTKSRRTFKKISELNKISRTAGAKKSKKHDSKKSVSPSRSKSKRKVKAANCTNLDQLIKKKKIEIKALDVPLKPILKRMHSKQGLGLAKKVSFCSSIFIRRFISEDMDGNDS